jgi:hypothetical protein
MNTLIMLWVKSSILLGTGYVILLIWSGLSYQVWKAGVSGSKASPYTWFGIILGLMPISLMFAAGALIERDPYVLWHTLYNLTKMVLLAILVMQICFTLGYAMAIKAYPYLEKAWRIAESKVQKNSYMPQAIKASHAETKAQKLARIALMAKEDSSRLPTKKINS